VAARLKIDENFDYTRTITYCSEPRLETPDDVDARVSIDLHAVKYSIACISPLVIEINIFKYSQDAAISLHNRLKRKPVFIA